MGALRRTDRKPSRGTMRRRLRRQQRVREALLLDLGALVFELHRHGRREPELLQAKAAEVTAVDEEIRALSEALGARTSVPQLTAPGIVGSCSTCGALLTSDARFCSSCGTPTDGTLPAERLGGPARTDGAPAASPVEEPQTVQVDPDPVDALATDATVVDEPAVDETPAAEAPAVEAEPETDADVTAAEDAMPVEDARTHEFDVEEGIVSVGPMAAPAKEQEPEPAAEVLEEPAPEQEPQWDAVPEAEAEAEAEAVPEAEAEAVPEPEPELVAQPEPEPELVAQPEPESEPEAPAVHQTEPQPPPPEAPRRVHEPAPVPATDDVTEAGVEDFGGEEPAPERPAATEAGSPEPRPGTSEEDLVEEARRLARIARRRAREWLDRQGRPRG